MNNNNRGNNNNNRRRGRGGNRQQGGGQQLNRIDSRARGNAPQLLEKYRKLAHDAHLNGDRVQEEYYLQFADHYFRVLADARVRQEEQRVQRPERWQEGGEGSWREEGEEQGEYSAEREFGGYEQQQPYQRPVRASTSAGSQDDRVREDRFREEPYREQRPREADQADEPRAKEPQADETGDESEGEERASSFEPQENPFVRENRGTRGLRPRRDDRRPRAARPAQDSAEQAEREPAQPFGLDPDSLPPAISTGAGSTASATDAEAVEPPRRRARRARPPADDAGEALEAVT